MALAIDTFDNRHGGFCYFKALGHPLAADAAHTLAARLRRARAAVFDPGAGLESFAAMYELGGPDISGVFIQDVAKLGSRILGHVSKPISALGQSDVKMLFIPAFDAEKIIRQIAHLLPEDCEVATLDEMRIPDRLLKDRHHYLNKLNFATNFLFFREQDGHHTRLVTANYWGSYGARDAFSWCRLFDGDGGVLCDFELPLGGANHTIILDSQELKKKYRLPDFCGQVFLSVINGAGHDVVKYVLDTYGESADVLSCTHDANAWPADRYAGLPAPAPGERVVLWIQNSHPRPIPAGAIELNRMGAGNSQALNEEIAPFASYELDIAELLPGVRWPEQLEVHAGKYFVRPRYEVRTASRRLRINHLNVERTDLVPDSVLPTLSAHAGKGYLLPAPILPTAEYRSECLPVPMSSVQRTLPVAAKIFNIAGEQVAEHAFGNLPRDHSALLDLGALAADLPGGIGHAEIVYDFSVGGEVDGWLHALFRYTLTASGHVAETSFGAHWFNHVLTYKGEPQSYKGAPPGLSTRLFIRCAPVPAETFFHLIYPVCLSWHKQSETVLELRNDHGETVAEHTVHIPMSGSRAFRYTQLFDAPARADAGPGGYIIVRDATCRLFGYQGVRQGDAFAFDHTFGF